jgi:hypothetical protein
MSRRPNDVLPSSASLEVERMLMNDSKSTSEQVLGALFRCYDLVYVEEVGSLAIKQDHLLALERPEP